MKILAISDTHTHHGKLGIPPCDLLIHSGDFASTGNNILKNLDEIVDFLIWFEKQPARHKVFIAGNHDVFIERNRAEFARMLKSYPGLTYLQDSGVEIDGLKIWGSPITPTFFDWSFMRDRGPKIRAHWDLIPAGTDILITHGPPRGIGDQNQHGEPCGCEDLRDRVLAIEPKLHFYGHIHEARGEYRVGGTRSINGCSISNQRLHPPIAIDL